MKVSTLDDEFSVNLSSFILNEIFTLIEEASENRDAFFKDNITLTVLSNMIFTLVYHRLVNQSQDNAADDYQKYKVMIQESISQGFESAFKKFTGATFQYSTKISVTTADDKLYS